MIIRKTKAAEQDLVDIYLYSYANFGEGGAEKYFSGLERAFGVIADTPRIGYKRPELSPPVRCYLHKHHLVVYTIEADAILIVRVLGKAMDIDGQLDI